MFDPPARPPMPVAAAAEDRAAAATRRTRRRRLAITAAMAGAGVATVFLHRSLPDPGEVGHALAGADRS